MKSRPVLYVLAGVNGAGKSSVGGHLLERAGLSWFNPDTFARELIAQTGCEQTQANAAAWQEGMRRLDEALERGSNYAFETTLGGRTVPARIKAAARTHDVLMWFCGLSSPEQHIARVKARVVTGGHDIPEAKIRERYPAALENLIALMPDLAHLQVYDNSVDVARGKAIPDPVLAAEMEAGKLVWPDDLASLGRTPEWAKPLLEAALLLSGR
ncbi:zeta toxin family protein [Lysobacter arenosi]|uniref:Zeta toxin family protein n=1 Tax=Lysobacter arenosi TaxID=2795387 RepID=A0ABX7RDN1_9GAMM|nr:AAA family ATPase [Lysobacter arenosi]QSX75411.1 zeta toxin family protein [Lysobacter arenosi]